MHIYVLCVQKKYFVIGLDDDVNNNKKSLDRALARKLFLIVKEKASYKTEWELPRETHKLPETMREVKTFFYSRPVTIYVLV